MATASLIVQAIRHFLTLSDRSLTQPQGIFPAVQSTAAAGPDQIVLYCAADLVLTTVHVRTGADVSADRSQLSPPGHSAEWTVVFDDVVTFTTGQLALIPIEMDGPPVPDMSLAPGAHRVVIATRGGREAAQMEEDRIDRINDGRSDEGLALGPEEWLVDIHA
ncbi:hypothetical protein ACFQU3_17695 [Terrabacter sp. GCM10028922]|uniref:hypothetical protein n=1 Tax=Terrabacter sp. GCM10028922 TaxID=3273428 RepID=UPI00360B19A7